MVESSPNSEKSDKAQKAQAIFRAVIHDEGARKARHWAIAAIAFAALGACSYICSFKAGFSLMILLQYASILFCLVAVVLGIKSSVIWFASKEPSLSKRFFATAIKVFFLGVILFILALCLLLRPLFFASFFLLFMLAPALGIIGAAILFRSKKLLGRFFVIVLIFILSIPLMIGGRNFLVWSLPHIYTPPALTRKNLVIYNECIKFAKNHDEYENLVLWRGLLFNGREMVDTWESFSKDKPIEIKELPKKLYSVRCIGFQKDNDMLLFYKIANSFFIFDPAWPSFLPVGAGALYSLSGENPNEIHSEVLNAGKPFIRIDGDWYISRHLMLTGPRMDIPTSIPKSLIDHSSRTEGFSLADLDD